MPPRSLELYEELPSTAPKKVWAGDRLWAPPARSPGASTRPLQICTRRLFGGCRRLRSAARSPSLGRDSWQLHLWPESPSQKDAMLRSHFQQASEPRPASASGRGGAGRSGLTAPAEGARLRFRPHGWPGVGGEGSKQDLSWDGKRLHPVRLNQAG